MRESGDSGSSQASDASTSVTAAGLSDVGRQRDHNEDAFAVVEAQRLFVVADGMGGHTAGDVASRIATETLVDFFEQTGDEDSTWPAGFSVKMSEEENRLLTGIRLANRQVYERGIRSRDLRGMGTTVVGATFSRDRTRVAVAHVGDSRCYRIRDGRIEQLTRDHSLVSDILEAMPDLPEAQRAELPKNVVTRALGVQDDVAVDVSSFDVRPGDAYVLCSDGLSGMVSDADILGIVASSLDPGAACRRLIDAANENGGEDNVSVIVVRVGSPASLSAETVVPPPPDSRSGARLG